MVVVNQPRKLLERWELTYEELAARNPRLVYVWVTCYGADGPYADLPGNGSLAEAFAGLTHLTGETDGPPVLPSSALGDPLVALSGVIGTLLACYARDVGGAAGQCVDVSMYEPVLGLLGPDGGGLGRRIDSARRAPAAGWPAGCRATSTEPATIAGSCCRVRRTLRSAGCWR